MPESDERLFFGPVDYQLFEDWLSAGFGRDDVVPEGEFAENAEQFADNCLDLFDAEHRHIDYERDQIVELALGFIERWNDAARTSQIRATIA